MRNEEEEQLVEQAWNNTVMESVQHNQKKREKKKNERN